MSDFESLGLSPAILRTLEKLNFEIPTPIQAQAIPLVLEGRDILGLAQTGTGKTGAFGLPLVQQLIHSNERPQPKGVRALILAPTRELANQILDNLKSFSQGAHLRIRRVVGGASINIQCRDLERGADIVVATPGRLLDLVERRAIRLDTVRTLVLDEADQMLDLGFIVPLRKIAKMLATPRQTMLFSATMPAEISDLADTFLTDPARVATAVSGKTVDKVSQSVHFVEQRDKAKLLKQLLSERKDDLSLVFCRTKHGAEKLMKMLVADGFSAVSVHGNKSQGQRERAISEFRSGRASVLVATDVAARGIDIPGVSHVYNLDLPHVAESYVHRIGRTARAGAEGQAVAFCSSEEIGDLRAIERLMKMEVPVASGEAPAGNRSSKPSGRNGSGARPAARGPKPGHRGQRKPSGGRRPEGRPEVRVDGERPAHADARPARAERPVDANGAGAAKKPRWRRNRKARAAA